MSELFNASAYLLDRQVEHGSGDALALTGVAGDYSYAAVLERTCRVVSVLRSVGFEAEQRVMMLMADTPDFVTIYLGAMRMGAIPVPVSTMLYADGLAELLEDSRARVLVVSAVFAELARGAVEQVAEHADLRTVLISGESEAATALLASDDRVARLDGLIADANPDERLYATTEDSPAFWLYTSGTTGKSKGAMHRHGAIPTVCETYATQVLGVTAGDRCLSAAKAFFAYGLGNSVLFPLAAGAASILEPAPLTPELIAERTAQFGATVFGGGPTFFANMLRGEVRPELLDSLRVATSAGEALPAPLYERWTARYKKEILDGLGMTEMLHIFLSNQFGRVRAGTTGVAVPGYELRLVDEDGHDVKVGAPGMLLVRGDSTATGYWSRYEASRLVFQGDWLRTGDTYVMDADGYYCCLGRANDMLKASGIWVSPAEVEERLMAHPAVDRAVVVAANDGDGLEKPVAYVILHRDNEADEAELIGFCREGLPSFKRPRRVLFVEGFPTTATGKVRRVELREMAATVLVSEEAPAP